MINEIINKINFEIGSFLVFSIILIPILFIYSKWKKDSKAPKLSLAILKWLFILSAIFQFCSFLFAIISNPSILSEQTVFYSRAFGEYWYFYWIMLLGNMIFPIFLLLPCFGRSYFWVFLFAFLFRSGIYMERFVIIATSRYMGGIESHWIKEKGILISLWIVQGIIYAIGLLGISYLILCLKKTKND